VTDVAEFDVAELRRLPLRVVSGGGGGSSAEGGGAGAGGGGEGGGSSGAGAATGVAAVRAEGKGAGEGGLVAFDGRLLRSEEGLVVSTGAVTGGSARIR